MQARRQADPGEKDRGGGDEEVVILEERDRAEIRAEADDQPGAPRPGIFRPRQHHADDVIERARGHEQEEEFPIPCGVKDVAAEEQPNLARTVFAQTPIDAEDREKEPEEAEFYKEHEEERRGFSPPGFLTGNVGGGVPAIIGFGFRDEAAKNSRRLVG